MTLALRADSVGKQYRIGRAKERYPTVREALARMATAPFRGFRRSGASETFWALRGASFELQQGEVLGIVGRNGAGKSTLLKILSRVTHPTEGYVEIHGRVGSLLEVGTGFHPELTGRENVFLNGAILGMRRQEIARKFDEIVAFAEVEKFIDTPVKRYSSGMYLRLAFAVAAHLEPEVLVVDEVLAVGDAGFQKKCMGKMENVAGEGRTILFVSHNLAAITSLCSRAILLESGQVKMEGSANEVVARYLSDSSSSEVTTIDLATHRNRVAAATPVFQAMRMLDGDGKPVSSFKMGDRVTFEVVVDLGERSLPNPLININIERSGVRVLTLSPYYMSPEPFTLTGTMVLHCAWDTSALAPGSYTIGRISMKTGPSGDRVDTIDHVGGFEIDSVDIYGTGRVCPKESILAPHGAWRFRTASVDE